MGTGTVVGATKIVDNGPDTSNWNLVVVGDGYTVGQQGQFYTFANKFVTSLQGTSPFSGSLTWARVNVYRVDVESDESGAINPAVCADGTPPLGGIATTAVSYFDAEYCSAGVRRALAVDEASVMLEVGALVPDWDAIIVAVNHGQEGGMVTSIGTSYALGDSDRTAIHELGHLFNLGDEYPYSAGCASGELGHDTYTGPEPLYLNLTIDTDRTTNKWAAYIDPATPMPTTVNPNPAQCDTQLSPLADREVGTFDGGGHYHSGIYRPAFTCMMETHRPVDAAFCKVCVGAIIDEIVVEESTCFVATAVYGDPWAPDVVTLRGWRDRHLVTGARGEHIIRLLDSAYGRLGPRLAAAVRGRPRVPGILRRRVFGPWARLVAGGGEES